MSHHLTYYNNNNNHHHHHHHYHNHKNGGHHLHLHLNHTTTNGNKSSSSSSNSSSHFKPTHSRARSDTTGITGALSGVNRSNSMASLRNTIGDLMSGRAFDNNCTCVENQQMQTTTTTTTTTMTHQQNGGGECLMCPNGIVDARSENGDARELMDDELLFKSSVINTPNSMPSSSPPPQPKQHIPTVEFECMCSAPRLAPEFEFMKSLVSIGKKLIRLTSKELKSENIPYCVYKKKSIYFYGC